MRLHFYILVFLFAMFGFNHQINAQADLFQFNTLPYDSDTIKVQVGFNLVNVTSIDEKEESITFDASIVFEWLDTSLAYELPGNKTIGYDEAPPVMYQGDFQVKELYEGWKPLTVVANGIGDKVVNEQIVIIWPEGRIRYAEYFSCEAETPMNLRTFPFDEQTLDIYIYSLGLSRAKVLFIPDDHLTNSWRKNISVAEWKRKNVIVAEFPRIIPYADGHTKELSELRISIELERLPTHFLISIIFPLLILVSLTWSVFWMDKQSITERVNISFIGILSSVTYYLVIQDTIPEISYLTLVDSFIILTFLILAASVVESLIVEGLDKRGKVKEGDRIDFNSRWIFPSIYLLVSLLLYFIYTFLYD